MFEDENNIKLTTFKKLEGIIIEEHDIGEKEKKLTEDKHDSDEEEKKSITDDDKEEKKSITEECGAAFTAERNGAAATVKPIPLPRTKM